MYFWVLKIRADRYKPAGPKQFVENSRAGPNNRAALQILEWDSHLVYPLGKQLYLFFFDS